MPKPLTPAQRQLLTAIHRHAVNGVARNLSHIGSECDEYWKCVYQRATALEEHGYIKLKHHGHGRELEIETIIQTFQQLPLL